MEEISIYQQAIEKMESSDITNHESDLYLKVNDISIELVNKYKFKDSVTKFTSKIDKQLWFDIPFAYNPFWDNPVGKINKFQN